VPLVAAVIAAWLLYERVRQFGPEITIEFRDGGGLRSGVEVGAVQRIELAPDARAADIHVTISQRHASLIRTGSAFWNVSGISLRGGVLEGVELQLESLRSLVAGGIEFASPEKSPRAPQGASFFLHEGPHKEWLGWNPRIPLPKED